MLSRQAFLRFPFIDICMVAIKNIRNMHAVSTNQIADILHFNDNLDYVSYVTSAYTNYVNKL